MSVSRTGRAIMILAAGLSCACSRSPVISKDASYQGLVVEEGTFTAIAGAGVAFGAAQAVTSAGGQFTVGDLPAGPAAVEITAAGYERFTKTVELKPGLNEGSFWLKRLGADGGCAPTTCSARGKTCGTISDECGGQLECGACPLPTTCGGGGVPNECGQGTCTPTTCAAANRNCGELSDGCDTVLQCGVCSLPATCGGEGTPGVCACPKTTCAAAGKNCGKIDDGCGGQLTCGPCTNTWDSCGGGGTPNVCGCTPATTCTSLGKTCGTVLNDCRQPMECGNCPESQLCGGSGVDNVCAVCATGTWVTQTAGSAWDVSGGTMKALALDPQGGVHITYYQDPDGLMHAYRPRGGSWLEERVAAATTNPISGVVVDSTLRVHIVFEGSGGTLVYATRPAGGAWSQQPLSFSSSFHGLTIDALGALHLSYVAGDTLMYARRPPAGSFASETVDQVALAGDNAIAVDGEGTVHICYQDTTDKALKHAARSPAGVWTTETVDSPGDVGEQCSIGASPGGDVAIAYSESPPSIGWAIKYARRPKGGSWTVEPLGSSGNTVGAPSVAPDGSERVVFEYYNYGGNIRYYRRALDGSWAVEAVASSEAQLQGARSMATDVTGGVHVTYQDWDGQVKYAYRCP